MIYYEFIIKICALYTKALFIIYKSTIHFPEKKHYNKIRNISVKETNNLVMQIILHKSPMQNKLLVLLLILG